MSVEEQVRRSGDIEGAEAFLRPTETPVMGVACGNALGIPVW
ncbi:hypothetical protein Pd630_LPD06221 [Rhodococcus opacus PD630]|jgi:hypothetical protein|nr:hypothetical protein Pd630_LPD06221 [Rhodococcus opacus PD630]